MVNTQIDPAQVKNLSAYIASTVGTLPPGATGPAAWLPVTAWAATTAYVVGPPASVVTYSGETYVCTTAHTSTGSFDATKWAKVAAKGADGAAGSGGSGGGGGSAVVATPYNPVTAAPTGLYSWHTTRLGITQSSGRATAWADQSGNARHFAGAAGAGPFVETLLDESTDVVLRDGRMTSSIIPATGAGARTVIMVTGNMRFPGGVYNHICHYGDQVTGKAYGIVNIENNVQRIGMHYWQDRYDQGPHWGGTEGMMVIVARYDGTSDEVIVNGLTSGKKTYTPNTGSGEGLNLHSRIGNAEQAQVSTKEIITWSRALTDAEVADAVQALGAYHGVGSLAVRGGSGGGGGGITDADVVRRVTGGLAVAANTSWNDLDNTLDLVMDAKAGDWVTAELLGAWSATGASFGCIDVVTVVSGSPVNSFTTGGAPDNTIITYGLGGLQNTHTPISGALRYQLTSGDISSGTVRLRLRVRTNTAAAKSIYASASEPFIFSAEVAPVGSSSPSSSLLAKKSYAAGTYTVISLPSGAADIDATNLAVTFTVPASGEVMVRLNGTYYTSTTGKNLIWQIRNGSTVVAEAMVGAPGATLTRGDVNILVTGLTPGASLTWKWGARINDGSSSGYFTTGGDAGAALMEVFDAATGSGVSTIAYRTPVVSAKRTAGTVTFSSATPTPTDTATDLVIPAVVGDWIEVGVSALWNQGTSGATWSAMDAGVMVAGSLVRYLGDGSSSFGLGVSGWFTGGGLQGKAGSFSYQVQSGDVSGGNITLRNFVSLPGGETRPLRASVGEAFTWWVKNLGHI